MMKHLTQKLIFSFIFLITTSVNGQQIKLNYKQTKNGYIVYADNNEYCPVSVRINLKLKNLKSTKGNNKVFVIPERTNSFEVTELNIIKKGKKYGVSSSSTSNYGNHNQGSYNKGYVYELPFESGREFKIMQGYNGSFSHYGENKNALDFDMPIGTAIASVRNGIVVKVVDKNNRNCAEEKCKEFNNTILIYHNDGTFAEYAHIKYRSSKVKVGDKVEKGQILAQSGNVGWSSAPHLHFAVFKQKINTRQTLETKFKVTGKTIILKERETYKKG